MTHVEHSNEVRLVGRLSVDAEDVELPSGDHVVVLKLVVSRPPDRTTARAARRGPGVDVLRCVVPRRSLQRYALRWQAGDVVELTGSLRRHFRRTDTGPASRYEVEVAAGQRLSRVA